MKEFEKYFFSERDNKIYYPSMRLYNFFQDGLSIHKYSFYILKCFLKKFQEEESYKKEKEINIIYMIIYGYVSIYQIKVEVIRICMYEFIKFQNFNWYYM